METLQDAAENVVDNPQQRKPEDRRTICEQRLNDILKRGAAQKSLTQTL
jgi:hypothetical protein